MKLEEMKTRWQADAPNGCYPRSSPELVKRVSAESERFDRRIKRRDWIETVAAVLVMVFFAFAFSGANWVSRVGIIIVIVSSAFIVWRLRDTRKRHSGFRSGHTVSRALEAEIRKRRAQIGLLENIHWWYLAPLTVGVILIFTGVQGLSWVSLAYGLVVVAFAVVVYYVNQRCVRRDLRPALRELQAMRDSIESNHEYKQQEGS